MKFFYEHIVFIRKLLIIIFLTIIILLLIMGRFRTMRIRWLGKEECSRTGDSLWGKRNVPVLGIVFGERGMSPY